MKIRLIILLLIISSGCIDEFGVTTNFESGPIIEGLIADEAGSSFVRITVGSDIFPVATNGASNDRIVSGATVFVTDEVGNEIVFNEVSLGLYMPTNESFRGEIGMSYTLNITLSDGTNLRSTQEVMNPGLNIDSIIVEFEESFLLGTEQLSGSHRFFIRTSFDNNSTLFFRTESNGIAQVISQFPLPPEIPLDLIDIDPEFDICWSFRTPINNIVFVGNTENSLENALTFEVGEQFYDYSGPYYVEVTLFSLSEEGFIFWNSIRDQQDINGSIFDPQLAEIRGSNIFDTENNELIIGYFGASSICRSSLLFDRTASAGFGIPIRADSICTNLFENSTFDRPDPFR